MLSCVLNGHLAGFSQEEWQQLLQFLHRMLANGQALRGDAPMIRLRRAPPVATLNRLIVTGVAMVLTACAAPGPTRPALDMTPPETLWGWVSRFPHL